MANWQERINSEIKRREIETAVQKLIETPKVVIPAISKEESERMRIAGIDLIIQKLSPEERNVFGLLDRIGAKQMLTEIGDEIWGHGSRVEPIAVEEVVTNIRRGSRLVFRYEHVELESTWTHHTKREFGSYEEISGGESHYSHGGEVSYGVVSKNKRFGWHEIPLPNSDYRYVSGFKMQQDSSIIDIYISRFGIKDKYHRRGEYSSFNFVLAFWGGMKSTEPLALNPKKLDEVAAKKFLEQNLLENCIERKTKGYLPVNLLARHLSKEEAERAVREHRKF